MTRFVQLHWISGAVTAAAFVLLSGCGGGSGSSSTAPPLPTHFAVTPSAGTAVQGVGFTVTVAAIDTAGNLATSYSGSVRLSSSDSAAVLPAPAPLTNGQQTFSVTMATIGPQTISATDTVTTSLAGQSPSIAVIARQSIAITSGPPPGGVVGARYSPHEYCKGGRCGFSYGFSLAASGGVGNVTWTWAAASGSSLPPGLSLASNVISGTPPVGSVNSYNVIVTATDGGSPAALTSLPYTITIVNPPLPAIAVLPGPQGATLNQPYSYQFQVTGLAPFAFSATGALPPGLAPLTATGLLAGTPTSANLYPITVHATDPAGQPTSQAFTIGVFEHGFSPTGSMQAVRALHTATLLASGQVLVTGGLSNEGGFNWYTSSELFTPANGSFATTGALHVARAYHTATQLCDLAALPCTNPKVLVVGGEAAAGAVASAELYDPAAGTFALTGGSLVTARYGHTATRLLSGKVLIAGGNTTTGTVDTGSVASAELFDPATGTFSATATPMASARFFHTATLLSDGRVLITGGVVAGGAHLDSAELFDPATGTFSTIPSPMTVAREGHTATLLPGGKVLIAGGLDASGAGAVAAELYDPAAAAPAASFTTTGALVTPRWLHTAVLLPSGQVLIVGGSFLEQGPDLKHAELYDPASELFASTGGMQVPRTGHTLISLGSSGKVLVVGGTSSANFDGAVNTAEVYQ